MILLRSEQPGDVAAIHGLVAAAFPTDAEARLVDTLRASHQLAVSLVAEEADRLVGHIAFSPVTLDAAAKRGVGLAPIAVADGHRRRGIGTSLIEAGLAACRSAGFEWCVVLGEPHFYARFGFQVASLWGLCDEFGGGDAFQVLELLPNGRPQVSGIVRYASAFNMFA